MLYRILMNVDTPIGSTLPDMLITVIICEVVNKLYQKERVINNSNF